MSEHQKKTRTVLSSLGCEEFFSEKCVPSLVTSLQKISSTGAEAAGIRGSRFISAQLQAEKLRYQLEKEEQDEQVTSFFRFVCNKVWSITFSRDDLVSSSKRHFLGRDFLKNKCKQHKLVTTSAYHEGFIVALRGRHRRVTRNKENNIG